MSPPYLLGHCHGHCIHILSLKDENSPVLCFVMPYAQVIYKAEHRLVQERQKRLLLSL